MDHHKSKAVDTSTLGTTPKDQVDWVPPPSDSEGNYELYTDEEGLWVVFRWRTSTSPATSLAQFLSRWPPSRTSSEACAWIAVNRGYPKEETETEIDVEGLQHEFRELIATGATTAIEANDRDSESIAPEQIDVLARKYRVLSGKWMVFSNSAQIDGLWRRIVQAVCFHRRKGTVKVSTRKVGEEEDPNSNCYVVCIYVDDYTDLADVYELRNVLRSRAGIRWRIGFKTDVYTLLGIYKQNAWGIRPSLYLSK